MRIYNWINSVKKYLEKLNSRQIALWGNDSFTYEIFQTIEVLGHQVAYFVTDKKPTYIAKDVKFVGSQDICNLKNADVFFLVAEIAGHKEAYQCLVSNGYLYERDFFTMGIGGYTQLLDSIDSLLTLNRSRNEIIGFVNHGNKNVQNYKIVILGNSTSDPTTGMLRSWPELLQKKFTEMNMPVDIINGAITGYSSSQEYLKLNRDVFALKPSMVISFSGFNDVKENSTVVGFPYLHKYEHKFFEFLKTNVRLAPDSMFVRDVNIVTHGGVTNEQDYQVWLNNMRKMHAVCSEFNIKFYAFLQPMLQKSGSITTPEHKNILQDYYQLIDSKKYIENEIYFCDMVQEEMVKYEYMINLLYMFDKCYNVFYDICHYTEYGNTLISEAVFDVIIDYVAKEIDCYEEKN